MIIKHKLYTIKDHVLLSYVTTECNSCIFPVENMTIRLAISSFDSSLMYYNSIQLYKIMSEVINCKLNLFTNYCFVTHNDSFLTNDNKNKIKLLISSTPKMFIIYNLTIMKSFIENNVKSKADLLIFKTCINQGLYVLKRKRKKPIKFVFNGEK